MSIQKKLISGAFWNSISQFGSQALNFVFTIILARLLSPNEFGLLGQVAVFTSFLGFFSEFGFLPTLIQKKNTDTIDYNTAFYSIIFFSFLLYILVYTIAPLIGLFYGNDELVQIARILFIQFLIQPFGFINEIIEIKNLRYNKIAVSELSSLAISGILGIFMAYSGFGVWSLIWQSIARTLIKSSVIFMITAWRPKFIYSFQLFKVFLKSGSHFTYRNLTLYLSENIDFLLIGKVAGARMLGIYNLAFRMSNYPFTKLQQIFGQMLFPVFNMFIDDKDRVRKNYLKLSRFGGILLIPLLLFIFFGIEPIVKLLLGEKWIGTILIVKILVIYLLFSSISFADDSIMLSLDKIKLLNINKTVASALLVTLGFFATSKFGAIGMATVFSIVSICNILVTKIILLKVIDLKIRYFLKDLREVFILALFFTSVFLLYYFLIYKFTDSPLIILIGQVTLFSIFMLVFLIKKNFINIKKRSINLDAI